MRYPIAACMLVMGGISMAQDAPVIATAALRHAVPIEQLAGLQQEWKAEGGTVTYVSTPRTKHGGAGHFFSRNQTWSENIAAFEEIVKELNVPQVEPVVADLHLYGAKADLDRIAAKYSDLIIEIQPLPTAQEQIDTTFPFDGTAERLGNGVPITPQ